MRKAEISAEYYVQTVKEIRQYEQAIHEAKNGIMDKMADLYEHGLGVLEIADITNYSTSSVYRFIQESVRERKRARE